MKKFKLVSTGLVFTPGIMRALPHMPKKNQDGILGAYDGLSKLAKKNLLAGRYEVHNDAVIVEG